MGILRKSETDAEETTVQEPAQKEAAKDETDPKICLTKVYCGVRINVYADGKSRFSWKAIGVAESKDVSPSESEAKFAAQRAVDAHLRG